MSKFDVENKEPFTAEELDKWLISYLPEHALLIVSDFEENRSNGGAVDTAYAIGNLFAPKIVNLVLFAQSAYWELGRQVETMNTLMEALDQILLAAKKAGQNGSSVCKMLDVVHGCLTTMQTQSLNLRRMAVVGPEQKAKESQLERLTSKKH